MATDVVRNLADNIIGSALPDNTIVNSLSTPIELEEDQELQQPAPELTLPPWSEEDSDDVDIWLGGDAIRTQGSTQNNSRVENIPQQRSVVPRSRSLDANGFWYMVAMMLPLFSFGGARGWRCSPSVLLSTVELFFDQLVGFCRTTRSRFQTMSREDAARDVFAGAMDIILVTYAIGFFLLTLYHASVFGHM